MTNASKLLQSLLVYSLCVPLALILGYMAAAPLDLTTFGTIGLVMLLLSLPLFLRYHHPLLVFFWNANMLMFFLPGRPKVIFVALAISLLISLTHRALSQRPRFISVPSIAWPLVALIAVALGTAELRGGIGLRSLGGSVYGGQRYVYLLAGVLGFFALSAQRTPPARAALYVGLFFLSNLTSAVGDLFSFTPQWGHYLFLVFPPNTSLDMVGPNQVARWNGLGIAASAFAAFLMARHGIRGIFLQGKPLRLLLFVLACGMALLGGFRGTLLILFLTFSILFFLEGMHRTKLLPLFLIAALVVGPLSVTFVRKLPLAAQRALAILPIDVDPSVRIDAESSSQWRLRMWQGLLPQISQYLLLGKGYALSMDEMRYAEMERTGAMRAVSEDQQALALSGDYHSGPLSVLLPLGIWGALVVIWLWAAGCRALYRNYRYGDLQLKSVNTFLLVSFVVKIIFFLFIYGGLYLDLLAFTGLLGLSISLNGGVCQPASAPVLAATPPLKTAGTLAFDRPRPVLGRVER